MTPQIRRPRLARLAALAAGALLLLAPPAARADVTVPVTSDPMPVPAGYTRFADITYPTGPQHIAMASYMQGTGWEVQQIGIFYNTTTDTLLVNIQTMTYTNAKGQTVQTIAGDADGLGNPGGYDPQLAAYGGYNPAHVGGRGSIDMAFSSSSANKTLLAPVAIAGIPEYKAADAPNYGFQLAQYTGSPSLQNAYGAPITTSTGTLLNGGPSAQNPDFEFTISNFSKLYGLSLANGFFFSVYAGSPDDVVAGEDNIPWTFASGFQPSQQIIDNPPNPSIVPPPPAPNASPAPQIVPEPSSLALCGLGAIGFGFASRARNRKARRAV